MRLMPKIVADFFGYKINPEDFIENPAVAAAAKAEEETKQTLSDLKAQIDTLKGFIKSCKNKDQITKYKKEIEAIKQEIKNLK